MARGRDSWNWERHVCCNIVYITSKKKIKGNKKKGKEEEETAYEDSIMLGDTSVG